MKTSVQVYSEASKLPPVWDTAASGNPFLRRDNLQIIENTNPCQQRYFLAEDGNQSSIAVSYRHPLNILTFSKSVNLRISVTIIGIPLSIGTPGYALQGTSALRLQQHLHALPGIHLALNALSPNDWDTWHSGQSLPSCMLTIPDGGMTGWLNALRSPYRRRIRQARQKWTGITRQVLSPGEFDQADYRLYHAVWQRSPYKLECLPITFFQQFPANIIRFSAGNQRLGFIQVLQHKRMLYFILGGMDYALRDPYDIYWNLLLEVVQEASDRGCQLVDLGQTAESVKLRLGASLAPRYLYVHHRNRALHALLHPATKCLAYHPPKETYRVHKN